MVRFFINNSENIYTNKIKLEKYDLNHLKNVLRFKSKQKFEIVCDYILYECEYSEENPEMAAIINTKKFEMPKYKTKLFFSVLKNNNTELIIQKCTEIGIDEFYPVITKRTVARPSKNDNKKIERWQKIAESAAKQSEKLRVPVINNIIDLEEIKNYINSDEKFIVAYEEAKTNHIRETLLDCKNSINLLIGPEGGFELEEIESMKLLNAEIVTLGSHILRAETAAIVASWEALNAI